MSEGVDEGEKKGGGNKRKEVDQEEIGGRKKKKRSQARRGEARAGDYGHGTRGCCPGPCKGR